MAALLPCHATRTKTRRKPFRAKTLPGENPSGRKPFRAKKLSRNFSFVHITLFLLALTTGISLSHALEPRQSLQTGAVEVLPLPDGTTGGYDATDDYTLLVKFADAVQARESGQKSGLVSLSGADLSQPQVLANDQDARFVQVIAASDCPALEQMQSLAAQNTGFAQPDVRGLHRLAFSAPKSAAQMAALGNALQALP